MRQSVTPRVITLLTTLILFTGCALSDVGQTKIPKPPLDTLVSADWLSERMDDPNLVVLDCTVMIEEDDKGGFRPVSGLANYESGHIPSAGFADLMVALSSSDDPFEMPLPTPENFVKAMGELGVGTDSTVILYSTNTPDWAARVWWMLRWAGFDRVALLDGGLKAWQEAGHPLSKISPQRETKTFEVSLRPELIADRDQVLAAVRDKQTQIVDALPDAHFRGQFSMVGRPGHITGASNLPSSDLLDETGHFRSFDELDMMLGSDRAQPTITYCGGGVAASSVAFTMHRLGYTDVAVYIGSLQEWAADPDNPMTIETP